ncbi:MAG: hypothetical protein B7Z40_21300 [Bosea sp. 12-68-7]|nr:MAG: hypothetical protein B7Z40_21300 [Bosea sp. 12-68-7]
MSIAISKPATRRHKQQFARGKAHTEKAMRQVVVHLAKAGPDAVLSHDQFAAAAGIGEQTTRHVRDALLEAGLCEIATIDRDPRRWVLKLTPKGILMARAC